MEKSLSTRQEKIIFDERNLRSTVIIYWIEPNNLQLQFAMFNTLWQLVSPSDVRIDVRCLVKNFSQSFEG